MVRKSRRWAPGAKYHIISRGVRRSDIFYHDKDREKYLSLVQEAKNRYDFILHTYCLMTNHIHLQIETKNTPPGTIMSYINTRYAKYFNKEYGYSGHVFDKRYGDELIDSPAYELDLSKYIHLNPLKAKIVTKLEDYPWSSYRAYAFHEKSSLVDTKQILSYFPNPLFQSYEKYLKAGYKNIFFADAGKILVNEGDV